MDSPEKSSKEINDKDKIEYKKHLDKLSAFVKENPLTTIAIAAGLGILIGSLFSSRNK